MFYTVYVQVKYHTFLPYWVTSHVFSNIYNSLLNRNSKRFIVSGWIVFHRSVVTHLFLQNDLSFGRQLNWKLQSEEKPRDLCCSSAILVLWNLFFLLWKGVHKGRSPWKLWENLWDWFIQKCMLIFFSLEKSQTSFKRKQKFFKRVSVRCSVGLHTVWIYGNFVHNFNHHLKIYITTVECKNKLISVNHVIHPHPSLFPQICMFCTKKGVSMNVSASQANTQE